MHSSILYHRGEGMKKVLITGKNSYIGNALEKWLAKEPESYQVESIDMKDGSWKEKDFSPYEVVFHVAGIAHIKETNDNQYLYYKINRDLAYETAQKAKKDGVMQFVFLSSMSVYGVEKGIISKSTPLRPQSAYGKSKIEAEELIKKLHDESFTVSLLRPPMVYGKGCKGNYARLVKIALKTPIFPKVDNKRSMIYIENLCEFIKQIIDNRCGGLFFPQNTEYINTSEMVKLISEAHDKQIMMTTIRIVNKVFGDLVYDDNISNSISLVPFSESIMKTENK